ncbi:unnamed protein product [Peronospora farinosa]|uniref:Uncharacterized protein n=1 Tax=Peronospora farinosa TaxID=134698 RepID=A0AAV0U0W1_9STRA|nr:unnamed protein product [Peronospora farinosa]CAI5728336.1 unnamed protein product [Peronospora farinosa]
MQIFPSIVAFGAFVATLAFSPQPATALNIVPARPGSKLFDQFRPIFHFMARKNWMNDPCGAYYDEVTNLYHMFYQSNPSSTIWGNMTWGHAVSKDQVFWEDYPDALLPKENKWDHKGVFSGYTMKNAIANKTTIFYTSVTAIGIAWKKPYLNGEHVMYATTDDNGKTWQKDTKPLIKYPPPDLSVTGWRDPSPFHSKSLDAHFGYDASKGSNYLIIAGGVRDEGPRLFLYHAVDYVNWEYKGFLFAPEKNTTFSRYSESYGYNFEMPVYLEIKDEDGYSHNVLLFAAESEPDRYVMWAFGSFSGHGKGAKMDMGASRFIPNTVGIVDRSEWYAGNMYTNKDGKNVLVGWLTEDNNFKKGQPQGWDGILSLQREVTVAIVRDIYDVENRLVGLGDTIVFNWEDVECSNGMIKQKKTIKTLGMKPLSDLQLLRNNDALEHITRMSINHGSRVLSSTGTSFELIAEVSNFERGSKVGFEVRRSSDGDEVTTIMYDDKQKKVIINRSRSSSATCAVFADYKMKPASESVWGHFYLYDLFTGSKNDVCETAREKLRFHVFVDVSSVEVFVNDRFSLSARIYPCASKTKSDGIALKATGKAKFENVRVWTNPKPAWSDPRKAKQF